MSRIRTVVARAQKLAQAELSDENTSNDDDEESLDTKDEAERAAMLELRARLPRLDELFRLHRKVGEGTFSSVYVASLRRECKGGRRLFALKHLVGTVHPLRVEHELRCLRELGGRQHVAPLELCLRHHDTTVIVMPYVPHTKFSEYMGLMDAAELSAYLRALLQALRHVHALGVIHRDVKPSNFLYDRARRRYQLIDFGLAQRVAPPPPPVTADTDTDSAAPPRANGKRALQLQNAGALPPAKRVAGESGGGGKGGAADGGKDKAGECSCSGRGGVCSRCGARAGMRAPRAGTQGFRPPEVLLKSPRQGPAVDCWAAGVLLASVLCRRYPLLRAPDDGSALAELVGLLGSEPLQRAAAALGRRLLLSVARPRLCLAGLALRLRSAPRPEPAPRCPGPACRCALPQTCGFPSGAFQLCAQLLEPDPARRPSAAQALDHPFLRDPPL